MRARSRNHSRRFLLLLTGVVLVLASTGCDSKDSPKPATTSASASTTAAAVSTSPDVKPIAEFSGSTDKTTDPFKAEANWELQWQVATGKHLTVDLLNAKDEARGQLVDSSGKTTGSVFVSEAGEFKLRVTANGDWSVKVVSRAAK